MIYQVSGTRNCMYDENTDSYGFLDEILSYEQMVSRDYKLPEVKEEEFIRFTLDEQGIRCQAPETAN